MSFSKGLRKAKGEIKKTMRGKRVDSNTFTSIREIVERHLQGTSHRVSKDACEPIKVFTISPMANSLNLKFKTESMELEYSIIIHTYSIHATKYVHGIELLFRYSSRRIKSPKEALSNFDKVLKSMDLEAHLGDNADFNKALFNLRESILTHGS